MASFTAIAQYLQPSGFLKQTPYKVIANAVRLAWTNHIGKAVYNAFYTEEVTIGADQCFSSQFARPYVEIGNIGPYSSGIRFNPVSPYTPLPEE